MVTHHASLFSRYQELVTLAQASPQYADPAFLDRYARRHCAELLKSRTAILQEYAAFRADRVFIAYLETCAPQLLEWARWRVAALAIAEGIAVEPTPEPPAPPPAAKPKTPDEYREAGLNWRKVKTQDYRQQALLRLTEEQEFLDELRRKFPNLSPDELNRELQRFRDEVLDGPDDGPSGPIKTF